jgi:tight adherence protein B
MTDDAFWLGRVGLACLVVAVSAACVILFGDAPSPGRAAAARYLGWLDRKLRFLRVRISPVQVLGGQVALALLFTLVAVLLRSWVWLVALPAIALLPQAFLERRAAERTNKVEEQLEPWLVAIANALKASPSLGEAIASSTSVVAAPMSEEVESLVKEYELGTPLDRALDNFAERISTRTVQGTVLALKVARRSGGDYSTMLENAAAALRELARLEGVVRTKTAEGKAQAFVIALIPAPMVIGIHAADPGFFAPLAATFVGNVIVGAALLLWLSAILLARKVLAVDV